MKLTGTIIAAIFGFIFAYFGFDCIERGNASNTGKIYSIINTLSFNSIGVALLILAAGFFILAIIGIVKRINSNK